MIDYGMIGPIWSMIISRLGGVMVTFPPPTQQTGVRFPAVAGRPVTRLHLVQLRLEMHTPWFVGLTPLQLVQYLGTEWLRVTEKEMSTSGNPKKWE